MVKKTKKREEDEEVDVEGLDAVLKAKLKDDGEFKTYRNIVKFIGQTFDFDALEREARNLHSGRKSRSLAGKTPSANATIEAELQDGTNRSRLTQIRVDAVKHEAVLDEALEVIRNYIQWRYSRYLPEGRTKADRSSAVNRYLRRGMKLKANLATLGVMLDLYIKDIDQMGYKFTNTHKVLELIYSRRENG